MIDFSIDNAIDNIKNDYSKKIFMEVYSSYTMGNYRSAIVMLWSVVVTDLVLKLQDLDSKYNDIKAINILKDIKKELDDNPISSQWENEIIKKFHEQLKFFQTYEVAHMNSLHKMRHLSAHPVITSDDMLYIPEKYEVLTFMKHALSDVLVKDALFSDKLITSILNDLNIVKETLTEYKDIKNYFSNKFMKCMSDNVLLKFIKTLWKFIFNSKGVDFDNNRKINAHILRIIIDDRDEIFIRFLENEKEFISLINFDDDLYRGLLEFLCMNKKFFKYFNDHAKDSILASIENDKYSKNYEILKYESPFSYVESLREDRYRRFNIHNSRFLRKEIERCTGSSSYYFSICVEAYTLSNSYDEADYNFRHFILPNIDAFTVNDFEKLIEKSNINDQTYDRRDCRYDHKNIIEKVLSINPDFSFAEFNNFIIGNSSIFEKTK